jgi:hypothetical protein
MAKPVRPEPASPTDEPGQPIEPGGGTDVAASGTPENNANAQGGADVIDNRGGATPVVNGGEPPFPQFAA